MNKENLVNYVKKNKWALLSGVGFVIGGYFLLHTNFSYHLEDRTGKYILNPEYKEFHKYEWTDLKSVYPTKLAYDPAWFKLPPEKYIPKEQPIPREISNISDPVIRRQAYFNFLCKTEWIDLKYQDSEKINIYEDGLLSLDSYNNFSKLNKKNYFQLEVNSNSNGNPFISPIYTKNYYPLKEGHIYNINGIDLTINPKSMSKWPFKTNLKNQFVELISEDGQFYKIEFDIKTDSFLPAISLKQSTARFYSLKKPINREFLTNLGIYAWEEIVYDKKKNIVIHYTKRFEMGSFLPWQDEGAISNFSWAKLTPCNNKKTIFFN